jgi:hypothetical protein
MSSKSVEQGLFLYFWREEYRRRNPNASGRSPSSISPDEIITQLIEGNFNYGWTEECFLSGLVVASIVRFLAGVSLFEKKIAKKIADYGMTAEELGCLLDDIVKEAERRLGGHAVFVPKDFSKNEVWESLVYLREAIDPGELPNKGLESDDFRQKQLAAEAAWAKRSLSSFERVPTIRNAQRALGLWLWDKINSGVQFKDAEKELGGKSWLKDLRLEDADTKDLRRFYDRTDRCIKDALVHSLK